VVLVDDGERPVLHVLLDGCVVEASADETLGVEDGVLGVHGHLVFGCVADESLGVGEGDVGWGCAVALVVGDDLDLAVLEDTDTGVCGAQVNTDCCRFSHCFACSLNFNLRIKLN